MAVALPDEILSEILTPLLKVPEALFAHTGRNSPFASYAESTSAVLLVCKAWLRVSTPLLYNVVILRSKAQAQALDATLRKNGELGQFIKKLRVEGGFGPPMRGILNCAPGITDLCISLHLRAADSASGLVLGLPGINPRRIILHDDVTALLNNKSVVQLMQALGICAHKWTNLTTIVLPYRDSSATVRADFVKTICSSPTVKTVSVPAMVTIDHIPPHFFDIASNPSVETIQIGSPAERIIKAVHDEIDTNPRLKSVLKWAPDWTFSTRPTRKVPILQPTEPSFSPMPSTPAAIADAVWTRVLFFAMIAQEHMEHPLHVLDQYKYNQKVNAKRLTFLSVSKTFLRLGLPLLYGYPLFADRYRGRGFSARLKADPSLGMHLHEMVTRKGMLFGMYTASDDFDMLPIVSCCPNLTHLIGEDAIPMQWDAFVALAQTAGGTLVEFTGYNIIVDAGSATRSGDIFAHFTALCFLRWSSNVSLSAGDVEASASGLAALEVLEVDSCLIFPVAKIFALPKLRRLVVNCPTVDYAPFLKKHGHKITELSVRNPAVDKSSFVALCPNLKNMTLRLGEHHTDGLNSFQLVHPQKHLSLEKVVIHKHPKRLKADEEKEWAEFIAAVDASHFPALKEIRCDTCKWPTTEHAIGKSFWVKGAEALLERGIKLTDKDAVAWRPRLKARR
ncbi:hypothetical protein DFH09DRAFT_1158971 [Mycena vulgaris]|nr:hypothetical protein DFH09DRAFT_1158971 [Mycena vulgaris]